jgi:NTE family protein
VTPGHLAPASAAPEPEHLQRVLGRAAFFAALPEAERAAGLRWHVAPGGTVVCAPGDTLAGLWLVVHGRLRVTSADGRAEDVGEGGLIGGLELLTGEVAQRRVVAVRDTEVGLLPREALTALIHRHPEAALALARTALESTLGGEASEPGSVNVAVVPIDEGAPLAAFAEALGASLGSGRSLSRVDRTRFVAELGPGAADDDVDDWDATDRRIVRWVLAEEARARFVLYETDPGATAWTRRCLRMADRVLLVSRAETVSGLREVEGLLSAASVPVELVLLHAEGQAPSRTGAFLSQRPFVQRVHHVRLGDRETVDRVARALSGRSVGLVFGGGGARGVAHVGAVRALRALGVPIDFVGGTSAGGGIAAMVALGWDEATMVARTRDAFVTHRPFRRFTLPYHSLLDPHQVERLARRLFGEARMEDQLVPMFCLSADLVRGQRVVHRDGPLWRAVLATSALPGVLPPVWWDGRLLVDGGVLDNNPVRTMRELHEGPIVLIDVGQAPPELVSPTDLAVLPSNVASLWHRLKPWGPRVRVPTIAEIVSRTMTMARPTDGDARHADLYVRPRVDGFGLVDFGRIDALVQVGFEATVAAFAARVDDAAFLARVGTTADRVRALLSQREN